MQDEAIWRIPNYDVYKTEGPTRGHGGTAVVVKSTISHVPVTINGLENIQMTAIEIHPHNRRIIVGAVYIPPTKELLRTDLDSLTNFSNDYIFGGDFNAKHTDRNSRTRNRKGQTLQTHALEGNYQIIGPTAPTHFPYNANHANDVLDIFLMKPDSTILTLEVLNELSSDHNPVIMELDVYARQTYYRNKQKLTTNWALYRHIINDNLPANIIIQRTNWT